MIIPGLIVFDYPFLNTLGCNIQCYVNLSVCTPFCCQDAKFNRIQCTSGIPAGNICKKFQCIFLYHCLITSHTFYRVIDRSRDQRLNIFFCKRLQLKNARSGKQRPIYFKIRIFRRCTDQDDRTILHKRKQIILLSFIKSVDLIYEQDGLLTVHSLHLFCFGNHFFHIFFTRSRCIDLGKFRTGRVGNYFGKRGLPSSRRTIKND